MRTVTLRHDPSLPFHTQVIQQALDAGGRVELGAGEWRVASLLLSSGNHLHLQSGARLLASDDWRHYRSWPFESTLGYLHNAFVQKEWNLPPHYVRAVITAAGAQDVAVTGEEGSLIDGADCFDPNGEEHFRGPMGMVFSRCTNVHLQGYTFQNAANWCHQLDSCQNVHIRGITVLGGHDGVNVHHCSDVLLEDCDLATGDDCIAGYNAQNVTVRRCRLNTSCNALRIGAQNLLVEDCAFIGPGRFAHRVSGRHNTICAFEYYAMIHDRITRDSSWIIRSCTFEGVDSFIHYAYGGDWMHSARPLRSLHLENLRITGLTHPSWLRTQPDAPLDVTVRNVTLSGCTACDLSDEVRIHRL